MLGRTHALFGGLVGVVVPTALHEPRSVVIVTGLAAVATSRGDTSPDVDQSDLWRNGTQALPSWIHKHRGLVHWWGLPFLAWWLLLPHQAATRWVVGLLAHVPVAGQWLAQTVPQLAAPPVDGRVVWAAYGLVLGWSSHLLGDAIFGTIPLLPWGGWPKVRVFTRFTVPAWNGRVGLSLPTGGALENGGRVKVGRWHWRVPSLTRAAILAGIALVLVKGLPV